MLRQTFVAPALLLLGFGTTLSFAADDALKRLSLGEIWGVAYSPDGRTVATASRDASGHGKLVLWDVASSKARIWLEQPFGVRSVAFSPDGGMLAAGGWDNVVRIYEAHTAKLIATLNGHTGLVNSLAFSPDGKTVASAGLDKMVILWDVAMEAVSRRLVGHQDEVLCVAYFADGKSLATGGKDATVRVWDVETGKVRQTLKAPAATQPFEVTAVSPDGKIIAAGSWDAAAYLWDVDKGAIRTVLRGHSMSVLSLNFSPDGKTLVTVGGNDNNLVADKIRLWRFSDGAEQLSWSAQGDSIWSVRFAPDGRTLATAGKNQKVRIWETATGKERATLENGLQLFEAKPPPALTDKELDEIWKALAGSDGAAAQLAIGGLARAPDQAPSWLAMRLKPAPKADAQQEKSVREWIVRLDDDDFDTRQKAGQALAKLGATAGPGLRKALDETSSAEVRQRVSGLLEKIGKPGSQPDELRGARAIEALELINTDAARELLKGLAEGAPEALLTREAAASCRRMAKRP